MSGNDPKASLNCHASQVKIHHFAKASETATANTQTEEVTDDLPF
jgi:hypothetical protein